MVESIHEYQKNMIKGYASLESLALDFSSYWLHKNDTEKLWTYLDKVFWENTKNPWLLLQTVSREKLEEAFEDHLFTNLLNEIIEKRNRLHKTPSWFTKHYSHMNLKTVAYFSMEFMLGEALPIYSGGLGNVAGDQLKAASDLGVPVIGIGLFYQRGYFRQSINKQGYQQALYPSNDPGQLPIKPLRKSDGEWVRIKIDLPGNEIWIRTWEVIVGRVKLYLLDTNDPLNLPIHRGITGELYGGDEELRLKQEIILGIGGWKLLEHLDCYPEVCHLNEGHAAFAILERAHSYKNKYNLSFEEALIATKASNHFTTHTAVPAGFDYFSIELLKSYLLEYIQLIGWEWEKFINFGQSEDLKKKNMFNMAYLAIKGSGSVNAVSALHAQVSQELFSPLFSRYPLKEIPVHHITNGIHVPTWLSKESLSLWEKGCGKDLWNGSSDFKEYSFEKISDKDIWTMRNKLRTELIAYARKRLAKMLAARGESQEEISRAKQIFDPRYLTLGFARRFASYKRPNMLLKDKERLIKILTNPDRPVQLLIAGKAHPADKAGQEMIHEWMDFIWSYQEAKEHVIFLSDYDVLVAEHLVKGVDLWINTPKRPWEACGTSGMKILGNGGLNFSELDGWWAEAYEEKCGWALGDGQKHESVEWENKENQRLYQILEELIIPEFYEQNEDGIPLKWVSKVKHSLSKLTPYFSADRAVREYTSKYYIPRAQNYAHHLKDQNKLTKSILEWLQFTEKNWPLITVKEVHKYVENEYIVAEATIDIGLFRPEDLIVDLFHEIPSSDKQLQYRQAEGSTFVYKLKQHLSGDLDDYTLRVLPYHPDIDIGLYFPHILWEK
ncbi:MAG: alpha-glucan family phosphorylase [Rhabdochlamydiaceae bacterium]